MTVEREMEGNFDRGKWRHQAWRRFQRASQPTCKRSPARGAEAQWHRDMLYIEKLSILIDWCTARRLTVRFAKREAGVFEPDTRTVTVSCRASPERQLHYILHEVGHFLVGMSPDNTRFGKGYPQALNAAFNRKYIHKLTCLEEEFEAWHRGWKLATRLNLNLDRHEFDVTRLTCLKSYIGWTSAQGK